MLTFLDDNLHVILNGATISQEKDINTITYPTPTSNLSPTHTESVDKIMYISEGVRSAYETVISRRDLTFSFAVCSQDTAPHCNTANLLNMFI